MNSIPADIHTLFLAVGQQTATIDYIGFDEETGTWSVQFEDDSIVQSTWSDAPPRLVFEASLGAPHLQNRSRVHEAVLTYNMLWQQTGGARIGLAGDDGELMLIVDLPAQGLEPAQLHHTLDRMKAVAASWAQFVVEPAARQAPGALVDPSALIMRA